MEEFQFRGRKESKAGFATYLFENAQYSVAVHTLEEEGGKQILYPFKAKVTGRDIDIAPDINVLSPKSAELSLPPSVPMERLQPFQDSVGSAPGLWDSLKRVIEKVEGGYYG